MVGAWTIEVGGTPRKWKDMRFQRSLTPDPQRFSATIQYNAAIDYFNTVEMIRDGTVEFYGYIEGLKPYWDESGRYLQIWGRGRKVILWKKFTERFSDGRLAGFFGSVDPAKLLHFLLRCPISDSPTSSDLSKIGWGLDANDWDVSAIRTGNSRHEDWVKNRLVGLAWQLGPLYSDAVFDVSTFTSIINDWNNGGTSGDLGDDDYTTYRQAKYYSLLTVNAAIGDWDVTVADGSRFSAAETIRISNQTASGVHGGNHEILTIDSVAGNVITFTTQLTKNYTMANNSGVLKRGGVIDEYWNVDDLAVNYGEITSAYVDVFGRHVRNSWGAVPYGDANVDVYVYDGSNWTNAGTVSWVDLEYGFLPAGWADVVKSVDVSAIIDTFAKANACRIKLECTNDSTLSMPRISEINLRVTGHSYQIANDWFKIDLGAQKNRVTGIYIESRKSATAFPVHYKIQTSPNDADWTDKVTVTNNTAKDIIESWAATDSVRYIKILITTNAAYAWEISQIYVYCADNHKYCVLDEGSGDSLGPYLGTVTVGDYVSAEDVIKPINLPFGRLNENIDEVVTKCHNVSYGLWEWWVDYDDGEFRFAARKGTDLSASISFVKGVNIKSVSKEGEIRGVESRVRVVGKSEGKKQDEISSDWQVNAAGEGSINTFYEKIMSAKRISDKDSADILANVEVIKKGDVDQIYQVQISNDTYASMAYDVGDDVTITDSLTGMSGSYRIYTIIKRITKNGEGITFYVGAPYKDMGDNWLEIRKILREITGTGTTIEDWFAEGAKQDKLSAENITGEWEKSAKNDEETPPADKTDDVWVITNDGIQSQDLTANDNYFKISGSKQAGVQNTISAYIKNTESTFPNIPFNKNPRFKCDFKILDEGIDPANATTWYDDDFLDLLFGNEGFTKYFGFYVIRRNGVYELWYGKQDAGSQEWIRATETAAGSVVEILENTRYRLEAEVIWDQQIIKFMFNNEFLGIVPFHASEDGTSILFPMTFRLVTDNPAAQVSHWAKVYIYKWESEWDWVA